MVNKWVLNELEGINIGDSRLNKRIMDLLEKASKQPQASINKMFHTRKEVQACYRFFSNDLVDETKIITPHINSTFNRSNQHPVLLSLSDTTSLNYTTRKELKASGYISSNNAQGFFLHANIVVTPDRLHLGIGSQKIWAREKKKPGRSLREYKPLIEKESYRWLEAYRDSCKLAVNCKTSQVVHITDREGDIFEIFAEYESRKKNEIAAEYIVRSNHNRTVYSQDKSSNTLIEKLEESKKLGEISFEIIDRENNTTRRVRQSVQAISVEIKSRHGADTSDVKASLNAIYLKEIDPNPPEGEKPVIWCLLTSLPINSLKDIMKVVEYYLCRWEIEVFFKTYKSGCKVEEKSLRSAERLYPLFSLFLIVAWRINFLLHMSRVNPNLSCDVFFEESEWKAGYVAATRNRTPPSIPPSMKEMMGYVGKLGGHLGRKNDPAPGVKAIWVGICKLTNYADAWDLFGPGAAKQ
jgi:Transposase DNA-binding/Transposase Tn5 dimerisation domain